MNKSVTLTVSQRRTLDFIVEYFARNQMSPTAQEIADGTGIVSRGVVYRYLKALDTKGFITLTPGRHRNIILEPQRDDVATEVQIPILGRIAAGRPIEAVEDAQFWSTNDWHQQGCFALRVQGDSMTDVGIYNGDLVILRECVSAENGAIVVALVDHSDVTLKRFYDCGTHVELRAENPQHETLKLAANRVKVQGVLVGMVRSFL